MVTVTLVLFLVVLVASIMIVVSASIVSTIVSTIVTAVISAVILAMANGLFNKINGARTSVVACAMLGPIACMSRWNIQIQRLMLHTSRWLMNHHRLRIDQWWWCVANVDTSINAGGNFCTDGGSHRHLSDCRGTATQRQQRNDCSTCAALSPFQHFHSPEAPNQGTGCAHFLRHVMRMRPIITMYQKPIPLSITLVAKQRVLQYDAPSLFDSTGSAPWPMNAAILFASPLMLRPY